MNCELYKICSFLAEKKIRPTRYLHIYIEITMEEQKEKKCNFANIISPYL